MKTQRSLHDVRSPWVDRLPSDWRLTRIDRVATAWTSNVDKHTVEGEPAVRLCNYTDVYKNPAITGDMTFMVASATPDQIERFRLMVGDTVITKDSETADDIGIPAFVEYEARDLICGYHLAIVRPERHTMHPRYMYWSLSSAPTLRQWAVLASGVTRVGIRSADLTKASIPLPPLVEQKAIADFLDRETTQIDTLIAKQEQLIETLKERLVAVVRRTVTAGIEPAERSQCDGASWIGSVPGHWAVLQLRRVGHFITGATPPNGDLAYYTHEASGRPWVRPQDLSSNTEASARLTDDGWASLRSVPAGSVLVGCIAYSLGKVGFVNEEVTTNQQITSIVPNGNGRYLYYVLRAANQEIWATSHLNRVPILNNERLGSIHVPWPPTEEQHAIADHLDDQTTKVDDLTAKTEQFIALAKERRAALIAAAVTGQIDVSKAV